MSFLIYDNSHFLFYSLQFRTVEVLEKKPMEPPSNVTELITSTLSSITLSTPNATINDTGMYIIY